MRISTFALLCLLASVVGCATLSGGRSGGGTSTPQYVEQYRSWSPDRPAIPPENVSVLAVQELPDGLRFTGQSLEVREGFPSAEDPHVIVGIHIVSQPRDAQEILPEQERIALHRAAAASRGANAIFVHYARNQAYLLHLSSVGPSYPEASTLLATVESQEGARYRRISEASRDLGDFALLQVAVPAMSCVAMAVALDQDASYAVGNRGFVIEIEGKGPNANISRSFSPAIREHFAVLGCAGQRRRQLTVQVRPQSGQASLGSGPVVVRTYAVALSARDRADDCASLPAPLQREARVEGLCRR